MKIKFYPNAETELNQAIGYYEEVETGIDFDLVIEVHSVMKRIVLSPGAWPVIESENSVPGISDTLFRLFAII